MSDLLKQTWFWGGISAVVALLTFLFTHFVGKRRLRYWRLQRVMDSQRSFYSRFPAPRQRGGEPLADSLLQQYVASVSQGLEGVTRFSQTTTKEAKGKLRQLVSNLRSTHQTLVTGLEPFSLGDAKQFFEGLDGFNRELEKLYHSGNIPHDARTHCSEIEEVITELSHQLKGSPQGWKDISNLRYSVVSNDRDVIVPMMIEVLERARMELSLIGQSVRDGHFTEAIFLKERFWFEVKGFYKQLTDSLATMSGLVTKL